MPVEVKIFVSIIVESSVCPNHYLMVEEKIPDGIRINQPSGYLEIGETPEEGAIRKCKEITGLNIKINGFVGCYLVETELNKDSYLTITFHGEATESEENFLTPRDNVPEIKWIPIKEIKSYNYRSLVVLRSLEDYIAMIHNKEKPECVVGVTSVFLNKITIYEAFSSIIPSYRY